MRIILKPFAVGKIRIHYGTWESAVYGLAHAKELSGIRKKLFKEPLPYSKPRQVKRSGRNIVHNFITPRKLSSTQFICDCITYIFNSIFFV